MNGVKNLTDLIRTFSDEQKCRDFLVQQRWNGSPVCPYCNSDKWYSIENGKRFKCGNKECHKKYSVTVGTIFHGSNIPLTTWFPACYLITAHKKGISSCQLARDLGVCQKTAWFMLHRVRESLKSNGSFVLRNTVEIDEVYIGGKQKNMSNKKRAALREQDSNFSTKTMVIGMVERGGDLRLEVAGAENSKVMLPRIINDNVDTTSNLMTDGEGSYVSIGKNYASHHTVNHTINEYVREGNIHTNTIEGAFGLFRRTIIGTYHKLSPKHLSRYCDEMSFRYNTREANDGERFEALLGKIETPLSWKQLIKDNGFTAETIIEPQLPSVNVPVSFRTDKPHTTSGVKVPVAQILNGKVVATYESIKAAAIAVNGKAPSIANVLKGKKRTTAGYEWKYL